MVKFLRLIKNIIYFLAIILLVFVCLVITASVFEIPGGYRFFMVESGSMEPTIKTASVTLIKKFGNYNVGDIVTFNANPGQPLKLSSSVITHRIVSIKNDPQKGRLIITKGDANRTPDPEPIKKEQILGKVIFDIPYLGYPVGFAKTREGLIILVIIPATLIIYSEIISIKNETVKLLAERKKRKLNAAEKMKLGVGEQELKIEKWYQRLFKKKK